MDQWLLYCGVVFLVVYCPGPMTMFSLSNGIALPRHVSLAGIAGGTVAYCLQIAVTYFSLGWIAAQSQGLFHAVKLAGAGYFFWMAYRQIASGGFDLSARGVGRPSIPGTFAKGFAIAATNPKSIVFFGALFPQFIRPGAPYSEQFIVLGLSYLAIQFSSGLVYVVFGSKLIDFLQRRTTPKTQSRVMASALALVGLVLLS
ncbi:LysE family translocator [Paludibacterium purpuratum]|uniref:Homoserine/homoserine lactone efflux protein n=1 Tax=Paludibacterium purpuratum TaxID=1144873 RepID=A0A4V3DUQ8_9NEIS|nr:LysE family translocator [Paludibacterium purpuratum]TDR76497.1 homoserine/homoserine lactone efflux protein [Paludibacterium purpuratum]